MSYVDFRTIQLSYQVKIVGWPEDVVFGPPCDMSMTDVRKIRAALNNGSCRFIKMSKKEVEELAKEKPTKQKRGPRRDKRLRRGPYKKRARKGNKDSDDDEDNDNDNSDKENAGRPRKRARRTTNHPSSSNELIGDTDDEEGA